jgi:hypothetical protein
MPKVVINRGKNHTERKLISERTDEINASICSKIGVERFIRLIDIAQYLECDYSTAWKYMHEQPQYNLPRVKHACGTKKYRTIDVARRLAELEAFRR